MGAVLQVDEGFAEAVESEQTQTLYNFNDEQYLGLRKYCNFLEDITVGEEVPTVPLETHGLKLERVIVLFRHGARGPLRPLDINGGQEEAHKAVCDLSSVEAGDRFFGNLASELAKKTDTLRPLVRHLGLPADFLSLPNGEAQKKKKSTGKKSSSCPLARLTVLGLAQHIKLGYLLSGAYSSRLGITSANWLSERVAVTTTEFSRTFQSAVALLYGISKSKLEITAAAAASEPKTTPSADGAFLPHRFNLSYGAHFCGPSESSHFCGFGAFGRCPALERLRLLVNHDAQDRRKPGAAERAAWDRLSFAACHRKATSVSPAEIARLSTALNRIGESLLDSAHYQHAAWLKGYGFLMEVIERAKEEEEEDNNKKAKLFLYSGHDITIEPLKAIFRLPDTSIPPFASRFIIEVISGNSGLTTSALNEQKVTLYLRFLYNGINVTPYLLQELVEGEDDEDLTLSKPYPGGLVKVETFERFVRERFFNITGTADYKVACKGEKLP